MSLIEGRNVMHTGAESTHMFPVSARLSRRHFLLRATAMGVASSAVGALLAACGSSSPSAPSSGATATVPAASTTTTGVTGGSTPAAVSPTQQSATAAGSGETPKRGGTVTIALNADISGMDPHLSSTTVSAQV